MPLCALPGIFPKVEGQFLKDRLTGPPDGRDCSCGRGFKFQTDRFPLPVQRRTHIQLQHQVRLSLGVSTCSFPFQNDPKADSESKIKGGHPPTMLHFGDSESKTKRLLPAKSLKVPSPYPIPTQNPPPEASESGALQRPRGSGGFARGAERPGPGRAVLRGQGASDASGPPAAPWVARRVLLGGTNGKGSTGVGQKMKQSPGNQEGSS